MKKILTNVFFFLNLLIFSNFSSYAETFVYSGGCFWCTEADTEKLEGVSEVISGFTAGTTKNPKYIPGQWGDHREAALVKYDPKIISFKELVNHVFKTIDSPFVPEEKSYPNRLLMLIICILLNIILSVLFVLIKYNKKIL